MNAVFLISIVVSCALQSVIKKDYSRKCANKGVFFFSALVSLSAALFFLATSGGFTFDAHFLPYSLIFGIAYATGTVGEVIAVTCGPLSLTTLVISYSLMLPTFFGLIFLKEPIGVGLIPGLVLLLISLFLIRSRGDSAPITPKWIFSVSLAFLGNGFCSISQKLEQIACDGKYKNEFMVCALLFVAVVLFLCALGGERSDMKMLFKKGWYLTLLCGIFNGLVNLFVMLLFNRMPASIMFPLISAGQIVFTSLAARLLFREKLTRPQLIGLVFGILAVVFLNL